ncbi:AAA-domain-containing protein [Saccharata proteae CBS 121410]|uniref:Peroxisomal ATPase PEX1 n=1 Tax=Saccharata proteae CBS 121410 TaxID=1314787 RepID=A0A9P4HRF3_9PEZI|nr:AAA-domain-containing protein [Saccharata proteae CBS 121410]
MAPLAKTSAGKPAQAEVVLLPYLKNCLVNLPASLVSLLVNADTVENPKSSNWSLPALPNAPNGQGPTPSPRSVFLGWTGMQAKRRVASIVGRDGLAGSRGSAVDRGQDVAAVELDATYGRLLGLDDGQQVGILLHLDPPMAHTINIEPMTPADWEMIELHAQLLEINFINQVRALPNPAFSPSSDAPRQPAHPVTLHLSPTSTANIIVTSLIPPPPQNSPFAKIEPNAEVIVAPKTRHKPGRSSGRGSGSVASTSRKSQGGRSTASTVRRRSTRDEASSREAVFLRGVDRRIVEEWFDSDAGAKDAGLRIWVDRDVLLTKSMRGVTWVCVSIVKPAGLQEPIDPQKEAETEKPAIKVVAKLDEWEDSPDSRHVALSNMLCSALGCQGLLGGLVRIEPAPRQLSTSETSKAAKPGTLKVYPFTSASSPHASGFKFGGESKQEKEEAVERIRSIYGTEQGNGLFEGPLTDGMILPAAKGPDATWPGGILRFNPTPEGSKGVPAWSLGVEKKSLNLELQQEVAMPPNILKSWSPGEQLPDAVPEMVGIDPLVDTLISHLAHASSVLLTGGLGSGKTALAQLLGHRFRNDHLFHTSYFPCRSLVTEETRVSTIKETLNRLFASASWGARLGGHSIVILDDLDRLCPAETELQVGGENGRSRHISESLCAIVRQYCYADSGVVLLATGQSKEAFNNVIIGGHVVREIVSLKAPNKDGRRKVLEKLVLNDNAAKVSTPHANGTASDYESSNGHVWMDGESRPSTSEGRNRDEGFVIDPDIDFLDLAGHTDGYMPGDLVLLASRARSEALIRCISSDPAATGITLTTKDFTRALDGFTPASLRNVTLQSSTTRWDSIGGLHSTRQILLETLQYPTTYAPIFAQCPLRLRSGLLLYGYPGCGKTLLASAVAGECGLNFISVKGPEILNKYIGASEKSVRDLFERAEAAKPCVLFFDEFDSIAPKRGHDSTGVTDRVVNQLLTQMDGAEGLSGVYILAATSRPDLIDPALLRPGRLDKSLICDLPDLDERVDILRAVTRKLRLAPTVFEDNDNGQNLREIARRTEGYSGADLQAVVYNAQLEAIHDVLGDQDMELGSAQNSKGKPRQGGSPKAGEGSASAYDFMHFRFGEEIGGPSESEKSAVQASSVLGERAAISSKIATMQSLRKRQKQLQHTQQDQPTANGFANGAGNTKDTEDENESKEPVIEWRHILSSLGTTRGSISGQDRRRLAGIYQEFVVGRNGEMPNGQGGTEVGGRTSLM